VSGARFTHPSAESFAFNSSGACPACQGLGVRSEVDAGTLVPDPDKTIEHGAVLPWIELTSTVRASTTGMLCRCLRFRTRPAQVLALARESPCSGDGFSPGWR
jgi:excinuclease UvrABC ATPase subunit